MHENREEERAQYQLCHAAKRTVTRPQGPHRCVTACGFNDRDRRQKDKQ